MKQKLIILSLILTIGSATANAQQSSSEALASRIAQKMKDSLFLTEAQRQSIYQVNLQLHNQKAAIWQQYNGSDSLISVNLQLLENTRDSLYRPIFSEEQYVRYKEKKRSLISNN